MKSLRKFYQCKFVANWQRWERIIKKLRSLGIDQAEHIVDSSNSESIQDHTNKQERTIISRSSRIKTLDDLLRHCEVDLNEYTVESFTVNKWESAAKVGEEFKTIELFQVKAKLKKKSFVDPVSVVKGFHEKFLQNVQQLEKSFPSIVTSKRANLLLEPFICDLHIGKLAFDATGSVVWNMDKAVMMYDDIISDIMSRIDRKRIKRVLLPVGNDLLNIDSSHNMTFKGTPQMTGNVFQTLVSQTELLLIRNIKRLMKIAPVDVVCIPGNHDKDSTYHIGRTIEAYFHNEKNVTILNSHVMRQYYQFKRVMIGFTHGNNEKLNDLPSLAAIEQPLMWGETKTREFHVGHFHHIHNKSFNIRQDERHVNGMTVRICPTHCPVDLWHDMKGYKGNIERTQTFLFSPDSICDIIYTSL